MHEIYCKLVATNQIKFSSDGALGAVLYLTSILVILLSADGMEWTDNWGVWLAS